MTIKRLKMRGALVLAANLRLRSYVFIVAVIVIAFTVAGRAQANDLVVGVNVVNPTRASVADQDAIIGQLKAARVRVIRAPLTPDDKGIDFAKRVYAQRIKIELQVGPQYPPNAPTRPYQPKEFPDMWGGHPLSSADPDLSRVYFQSFIANLEANGIVLAGLELGNEINWTAFNAEFPLPGKGVNFGLQDLYNDPEAKQIAKGYLQYLKILEALKDVRDHSKLNQHTPIILAGLADDGAEGPRPKSKTDSVSINATIQFLRANGLDKLVDFYGIHTYPWEKNPARREMHLEKYAVTECQPANSAAGKPCWITEWGIDNKDMSCPLDDTARTALVKEIMDDFRGFAKQGRLIGAMYFAWNSDPWAKTVDAKSIYRCGALTESGKLALSP
jgi:hypothetical protein